MTTPWYSAGQQTFNVAMPPLDRLLDTAPSNSREQRNKAEKMRRDKLNMHISELAQLVPMVASSAKRMDKTTILRLAASYLRMYHTLKNDMRSQPDSGGTAGDSGGGAMTPCGGTHDSRLITADVPVDSLVQLVSDQLGGFLMFLSANGKIVFVSHIVEPLLGHSQTDLMGQSIYSLTCPDDHDRLRHQLSHDSSALGDETGGEWRRNFNMRMARAGPRCEPVTYEPVNVIGVLKPSGCLNCVVRLCRPAPLAERLLEATKNEYVTRHLVDGRIVSCDQRISIVAGYMSEEVAGLSAFKFMHREDVRWTMIALRQMYDRGESRGSSCYRLLARTGQFVYLRTCGYLEVDSSGAVESFVCVNTLVTEKEGQQLIREMKARYSALIQQSDVLPITNTDSSGPGGGVEDPQQLEEAIMHLIHNLPGSPSSPSKPTSTTESQDCNESAAPVAKRARTAVTLGRCKRTRSTHAAVANSLDRQLCKHHDSLIRQYHRREIVMPRETQPQTLLECLPHERPNNSVLNHNVPPL